MNVDWDSKFYYVLFYELDRFIKVFTFCFNGSILFSF